jgi:ribosomal protein L10
MNKATILKKQETVNEIASHIKEAKSMVIVEYRGVSISALETLRRDLRK